TDTTTGDTVTDTFTYTAQDQYGNTVINTITVTIVDDVPTAVADTRDVTEGATLTVDAADGVLSNDGSGADGWNTGGAVVGVKAGNEPGTPVHADVATAIEGTYGTLTLNADGSYTYEADPDAVTADAVDIFTYTV